eukprot:scaffold5526_cov149-Ochromonas_danica.AAC.3
MIPVEMEAIEDSEVIMDDKLGGDGQEEEFLQPHNYLDVSKEEDFPQPDANIINHFTEECLYFWNAVLAKFLGAIADSIANLQHEQATIDQILINFLHLDWKFRKFVEEESLLTAEQGLAVMKLLSD